MHTLIDYSKRLTPRFDAVQDIKDWLGQHKWDEISPQMAEVKDPRAFTFLAGLAGIQGFPVGAWYDLYNGEGSYALATTQVPEEAPLREARFECSSEMHLIKWRDACEPVISALENRMASAFVQAVGYARGGRSLWAPAAIQAQAQRMRAFLRGWRGEEARNVKSILKDFSRQSRANVESSK